MVNEGRCHVDHAGLCICPWNGAAAGSGAQGSPEQGHQERWGGRLAKAAWTAGHERPSRTRDPGSRAGVGARHEPSTKQLGMMVRDCSLEQLMSSFHARQTGEPSCAKGWMSLGLSLNRGSSSCPAQPLLLQYLS